MSITIAIVSTAPTATVLIIGAVMFVYWWTFSALYAEYRRVKGDEVPYETRPGY